MLLCKSEVTVLTVKTNSISLTVDPGNSCSSGAEGILNIPGLPPIPMKFTTVEFASTFANYVDHNSVLTVCSGQYKGTYTSGYNGDAFYQTKSGQVVYYPFSTGSPKFVMISLNPVEL